MIRMIVATRLGGLPGNVRYPDTSFGFNTKQLNHQDKSTLGDISSLKQPLELLVSLSLPPNNTHNTHNTHNPNTEPSSMSNSNTELILEHWRIQFSQRNRKKADMTEKMLLERLKIGIRSLHALLSILPAFSFVRGPSLRFDEGRERPPCRVSKLSASNEHGGGRNSSSNNGATEGMRFEQRVGVPHSTHNNNGAYGVLRVDVIKSNPFSTPATSPAFTAECIDIPLSYGVLRIEVEYRQNIETTNIETPHIIHDYYVSAGGGGGGGGSSSSSSSNSKRKRNQVPKSKIDTIKSLNQVPPVETTKTLKGLLGGSLARKVLAKDPNIRMKLPVETNDAANALIAGLEDICTEVGALLRGCLELFRVAHQTNVKPHANDMDTSMADKKKEFKESSILAPLRALFVAMANPTTVASSNRTDQAFFVGTNMILRAQKPFTMSYVMHKSITTILEDGNCSRATPEELYRELGLCVAGLQYDAKTSLFEESSWEHYKSTLPKRLIMIMDHDDNFGTKFKAHYLNATLGRYYTHTLLFVFSPNKLCSHFSRFPSSLLSQGTNDCSQCPMMSPTNGGQVSTKMKNQ